MKNPSPDPLPKAFPGGCIRRLCPGDLASFQRYRNNPAVGRFQSWSPLSDPEALAFLTEMSQGQIFVPGEWRQLAIAEAPTDRLQGDAGVFISQDSLSSEVGITLEPSSQGRGIATAALRTILDLLFATTPVQEVIAITDARNEPSIRLLKRAGFALRETRDVIFRGEPCRECTFALPRKGPC